MTFQRWLVGIAINVVNFAADTLARLAYWFDSEGLD